MPNTVFRVLDLLRITWKLRRAPLQMLDVWTNALFWNTLYLNTVHFRMPKK